MGRVTAAKGGARVIRAPQRTYTKHVLWSAYHQGFYVELFDQDNRMVLKTESYPSKELANQWLAEWLAAKPIVRPLRDTRPIFKE